MLDVVRELERRDAATAAAIESALSIERALGDLRGRAAAVAEALARLPAALEQASAARLAAAAAVEAARARPEAAGEDEAAAARRVLELADGQLASMEATVAAVEREAAEAKVERDRVDADARTVSEQLGALERVHEVDPPQPGLAGVLDWTSRARAAVFVVRSGLEQERDRIVREAEELGATLLGEQIYTVKALVDRLS